MPPAAGLAGRVVNVPDSNAPLCARCGTAVLSAELRAPVSGSRLHRLCFHYLYEHDSADTDTPCGSEHCPSQVLEPHTPLESYWFFGRRHGPMQRYVEAGFTDRDVRRAMGEGIEGPEAIIEYSRRSRDVGDRSGVEPNA